MRKPSVVLLDEPCSGLTQDEIEEMDAIIREMVAQTGMAVIVVEHRLELLRAIAESVVVMDAGAVIAEGPPAVVFDDPAVRAAYFEAPKAA
jgi:ABC-type branched-subunit amino acid transport system ATPase component